MEVQKQQSKWGIVALVLGIIGLLTVWIVIGVVPAVASLILSLIVILDENKKHEAAIAGLACSIVAIGIWVLIFINVNYLKDIEGPKASSSVVMSEVAKTPEPTPKSTIEPTPRPPESIDKDTSTPEPVLASDDIKDAKPEPEEDAKENKGETYTFEHFVAIVIGVALIIVWANSSSKRNKVPKYNPQIKKRCPACGGERFHAFVEEQVIIPGKVKSQTTLNLNPLKPFTVFNHKEKVVRREVTQQVSKFVCDNCGKIFQ